MHALKRALREPLVHFLALGALLFVWFHWRGTASGPGSNRIVVTKAIAQSLAAGFTRSWGRPPTAQELQALVDDHVKEEIAAREAAAMDLDRDDPIIRARLRQKLESFVGDGVDEAPPTDAELQAWLDAHPESFPAESRLALRQVYVDAGRRGDSARAEAERLLARLQAAGPGARIDSLGDASMLPRELALAPLSEVARAFGRDFAAKVDALAQGRWTGPIESSYGLHVVLVAERRAAARPALADVKPLVERDLLAERRRSQLQALYERLLRKYAVSIERPREGGTKQATAKPAGGE